MARSFVLGAVAWLVVAQGCASKEPVGPAQAVGPSDAAVDAPIVAPTDGGIDSGGDEGLPPIDMTGPIGGSRPADVKLPNPYNASETDPAKKHPLIVLLHGYGATGVLQDFYFRLSREANPRGYVVALPDGTLNSQGQRFWNATDACCDNEGQGPDDIAYVRDLVRQIVARYAVDPARVYLMGHSNGGFLTLRLACEQAKRFAAVVSLAGATWADPARCAPELPIGVLTVHGTADQTVAYSGGTFVQKGKTIAYPSAQTTIDTFATRNGCTKPVIVEGSLDFVDDVLGAETKPAHYQGCKAGGMTEHWEVEGGSHIPALGTAFMPAVFTFLEKHARR